MPGGENLSAASSSTSTQSFPGAASQAAFWLNAQRAVDLWDAEKALKKCVNRIKPLNAA